MATEETKGTDLILPGTGEVVPRDASTDVLGDAVFRAREIKNDLDRFVQAVSDVVTPRMDKEGVWTVELGGLKISAPSPDRWTYDAVKVRKLVRRLVREDRISRKLAGEALRRKVEYTPVVNGLNRIAKISPELDALVKECRVKDEKPRRISVTIPSSARQ